MRRRALATTPVVLLDQAGHTPFSDYAELCNSEETGMIVAIVSSCEQLLKAPSCAFLLHSGIRLALRLSMAFGLWNELFTMLIQFLRCKLQLILPGATQGS